MRGWPIADSKSGMSVQESVARLRHAKFGMSAQEAALDTVIPHLE
jgi:hypothetical protein